MERNEDQKKKWGEMDRNAKNKEKCRCFSICHLSVPSDKNLSIGIRLVRSSTIDTGHVFWSVEEWRGIV